MKTSNSIQHAGLEPSPYSPEEGTVIVSYFQAGHFREVEFETAIQFTITRIRSVAGSTTKNYQSRETILTPTVEKILLKIPSAQGLLFSMKQRSFEARFYEVKKKYGLDWDLHSLRHSFVSKLRNANIPERVVAHYVGHAQKNVTDRYTSYTKEFIEASICAADLGGEFLTGPQNVVSLWSPKRTSDHQDIDLYGDFPIKMMPGAGIEPAREFPPTGF